MKDLYYGATASPCQNPCLSTQIKASLIEDLTQPNPTNLTWVATNFDQAVDITEYYYPEFSMSDFLSSLGGALGLWLGVGVVQIGGYLRIAFEEVKRFL